MNKLILALFATALVFSTTAIAKKDKPRNPTSAFPERPIQYVILAFDGSKSINFWNTSMEWADQATTDGGKKPLRFTYFINPSYYLEYPYRKVYTIPELNKTLSCIGWSSPEDSVSERMRMTSLAFSKGHEIGSHAIAHCDQSGVDKDDPMYGKPWSESDWASEFDQFNKIFFNLAEINKLKDPPAMLVTQNDVVGFRAPKLAVTEGLWPTLKRFNFRYDTSKISDPTYWPQKMAWGGWNFPLAEIKISGTSRHTLSMDYNWLVYHSGGSSKPDLTDDDREFFRKQMYDSYMYYFKKNYFGGRGPIHIGHHFSQWNGGAYWSAMKDFAKNVCNRKEVLCVTYKEYADYLDSLPQDIYENYRQGRFTKLPDDNTIKDIAAPLLAQVRLDIGNDKFEAMMIDASKQTKMLGLKTQLLINFKAYKKSSITKEELVKLVGKGKDAIVRAAIQNGKGRALDWQTYKITNLGTAQEKISDRPLEDTLTEGESSGAHE
jgi:hypothetical protein